VGTHLVYQGKKLALVSLRSGRALTFHVPPDDPHLQASLGFTHHLLKREFQPMRRIVIETINGQEAAQSPYLDALRIRFELVVEFKHVSLYRKEV
jgi:ATP-dependent Lhr-like helicase